VDEQTLARAQQRGERPSLLAARGLLADVLPGSDVPRGHMPIPMLTSVASPTGATSEGEVRYLPYGAEEMLRCPKLARELVLEEVLGLCDGGAEIVGLGGATAIVGDRGWWTAQQAGIPVTSGNSLTAYTAHWTMARVVELFGYLPRGRARPRHRALRPRRAPAA
jgi:predicted amino acid dehydrogenase